jgi:multiple sugar transport system permease protein
VRVPEDWWRKAFWRETAEAYLYLLPALVVLGVFTFYPFFNAFYLSLHDVYTVKRVGDTVIPFYKVYAGLANYRILFGDRYFLKAIYQTSLYVGLSVPITLVLALALASFLNQGLRLRAFYRLSYFLPYVTPVAAIGLVWNWIFDWRKGLLNYFLGYVGLTPINWLNNPRYTLWALVIMNVWRFVGYQAVILLAGMQGIDRMYYDAAKVDGASGWRVWRHVTLPLLTPQIFFVFIMALIGSFKIYEEVVFLFSGTSGPLRSAETIVYYIVTRMFQSGPRGASGFGPASAASVVLFGIIFVLTLFQLLVTQRRVHYER